MNTGESSLRQLVEKWFAPNAETPAHITQFGRMRESKQRVVRIESAQQSYPFVIFFFRHDDGSWRVFPSRRQQPAISYRLMDASTSQFDGHAERRAA
jgi:hypothetical protein